MLIRIFLENYARIGIYSNSNIVYLPRPSKGVKFQSPRCVFGGQRAPIWKNPWRIQVRVSPSSHPPLLSRYEQYSALGTFSGHRPLVSNKLPSKFYSWSPPNWRTAKRFGLSGLGVEARSQGGRIFGRRTKKNNQPMTCDKKRFKKSLQ